MSATEQALVGRRKALGFGALLGAGALTGTLTAAHPAAAAAPSAPSTPAAPGAAQDRTHHQLPGHYAGFPAMPASLLQFFAASQRADAAAWADAFAVNAVFRDPVGQPPITGRAAIRARIASILPNFRPFLGITPLDAHATADFVAVSWRGAAVTLSNRPVNWSGINVFQLDSAGLIKECSAYFEYSVFQAQLDPK
ncbi:nuclear transport factor 2 family protein [Kitasatospora sp. NPDC056651]|uniref:nuclear transport factor 2 family protein n=1 Tax=Kitasatospora sp. NPDC056651 TaxID=3345892 RepID=UPI0036BA8794